MKIGIGSRTFTLSIATALIVLIGVGVVVAGGIAGWEYSNSDAFCANMCHSVHPEETRSHKTSAHARVQCVECHMGRVSTLKLMALKPTHAKELWGMIAGYERPTHGSTLLPARENCEGCHWPAVVHDDTVVYKKRYADNEASSESTTRLTLHTGVGVPREGQAKGIHWHVVNEVYYKSPDPQQREIPWVEVRGPDGKSTVYRDPTTKLAAKDIDALKPVRMECYNCHNAAGHPFPNPADLVDEALTAGKIDRSLPFAKARAQQIIAAVGDLSGPVKERTAKIESAIAENAAKAGAPADAEREKKFQAAMKEILLASTFDAKGITWKSFPDHAAHKDDAGCFRCHNGKHFNEKGDAIRLQCTLCHDLPQVKREDGKGTVPSTVTTGVGQPPSHNAPNFMREHRFKLDATCTACHGKLEFGREGGNFCANPACHGRKWPEVNLSAKKPN